MPEVVLLFFCALALLLFEHARRHGHPALWLGTGVALALATLSKLMSLPVVVGLVAALLLVRAMRRTIPKSRLAWMLLPVGIALLAEGYWNYTGGTVSIVHVCEACEASSSSVGFSLKSLAFFLGELFMVTLPSRVWDAGNAGWYEWPVMHWVTGVLMLAAFVGSLRHRTRPEHRALQLVFLVTFAVPTVLYAEFWFNPFWHASPMLIPACIFAASFLDAAARRHAAWRWTVCALLVYLAAHACNFAAGVGAVFHPSSPIETFWYVAG
jgi:4-amino-4-deoxy-L-arabinose transferase-like glycosyltransferase